MNFKSAPTRDSHWFQACVFRIFEHDIESKVMYSLENFVYPEWTRWGSKCDIKVRYFQKSSGAMHLISNFDKSFEVEFHDEL